MIRVRYIMSVLTVLFAFSWLASAQADVLELKSGQKLEGQYAGGSREEIRFQVGSQSLRFAIAEVSKITIGSAGQEDFYKAAKEALRQLKALASVVEGGTTYQNYSPRVEDAKIKVDQFLDEYKASPVPKFNEYLADSLGFYVAASSSWNLRMLRGSSGETILAREVITEELMGRYVPRCAPLQAAILEGRKDRQYSNKVKDSTTLHLYGVQLLWECARNSMIDAEKALNR